MPTEKGLSQKFGAILALWRQFLPLSLSDVTMAAGDPAITMTVARLPEANVNLGAIGIAKSFAIFFESSIIMILHASNTLAPSTLSRRALARFTLLMCSFLTLCLLVLTLPGTYVFVGTQIFSFDPLLIARSRTALVTLILWPAFIGWRRYFQGLLIHAGYSAWIARAGIIRLLSVLGILLVGFSFRLSGELLAGLALIGGVAVEAIVVTLAASKSGASKSPPSETKENLPTDIKGVWRFYWPLANSMLVVWGGRILLLAIVAHSLDASIALAAWPAAWGLVLVVANATRMVQQVVIRNRQSVPDGILFAFAASVGFAFSGLLVFIALTPLGDLVLHSFLGNNAELAAAAKPVVLTTSLIPLLIAVQNALQGFLMSASRTQHINVATLLGTGVLIISAAIGIHFRLPGATAAALAMVLALCLENAVLIFNTLRTGSKG